MSVPPTEELKASICTYFFHLEQEKLTSLFYIFNEHADFDKTFSLYQMMNQMGNMLALSIFASRGVRK